MEAVLFGRFNLVTTGHMHYFNKVGEKYGKVHICITTSAKSNNIPAGYDGFYSMSDEQHTKNIFSIEERCAMLETAIEKEKSPASYQIHIINRPDYYVKEFNDAFPPEKYQLVLPRDKDIQERIIFADILKRKIDIIDIEFETHISDVIVVCRCEEEIERAAKKYLTPGCLEYFNRINGVSRIAQHSK